jgi:Fe-S-cluster formation regulator IscX/YfhJ
VQQWTAVVRLSVRLALPGLDPDEVRFGQLATLLVALSVSLAAQLLSWATMLF